jgi:hypothetical protein
VSLAIDELRPAGRAARDFLVPVDVGRWLRLALLALLIGGVGSGTVSFGPNGTADVDVPADRVPSAPPGPGPDAVQPGLPGGDGVVLAVVAATLAAVVAVGLALAVAGAVAEFVLVDGLVSSDVRLRRPFRDRLGPGVRLFAFRVGMGLLVAALVAAVVAVVVLAGATVGPIVAIALVPLGLLALAAAVVVGLVLALTRAFVVPTMVATGEGVLDAWRTVWPSLRDDPIEVGTFLVVRFVAGVAAGIAVGIVALLAGIVVAAPFAILGGVVVAALAAADVGTALVVAAVAPIALVGVAAVVAAVALVRVPVVVFFRYYALFVHGRLAPPFDLVGDRRGPPESVDAGADAEAGTTVDDGPGGGDRDR